MSMITKLSKWLLSKAPRRKQVVLSRNNIYIFPSAMGLAFLLLLLLMLLTAINYQNSLIYLVTFFLGTLFFISIWMCFLNLSGLKVEQAETGRCFATDPLVYYCRLSKKGGLPLGLKIGLDKAHAETFVYTSDELLDIPVEAPSEKRGRHKLASLYLESRFPFGLILAWTWLKIDLEAYVYPQPLKGIPETSASGAGDHQKQTSLLGDLTDLKNYQAGDATNRILWKKYAANGNLIVRHHERSSYNPDWVDWDNYPSASLETRLSYLCFDVCRLSDAHRAFGFSIPGIRIAPDYGELHKRKCLDALALFQAAKS